MALSCERHQHDYRLINVSFHKNLEIYVSSSLSNKQKHLAFKKTKIFLILMTSSIKGYQHDYRLMDCCFHKSLDNSCQQQFFKTKETSVQGNRNFHIFMIYSNYAINISVIIGSMTVTLRKTFKIMSVTFNSKTYL